MTSKEAQEILLLYRPDHNDPDDEGMALALEVAKSDPALAAWLEEHCRVQRQVAAAFSDIPVAEGLKEQIISERKARLAKSRRRTLMAACAALMVAAALLAVQLGHRPHARPNDGFANFRETVAGNVQRLYPKMDLETNNLPAIEGYLGRNGGHMNIAVPPALASATSTGCKVFTWHAKPVSMICFNSGTVTASTKADLFLFVIDRSKVEAPPVSSTPKLEIVKGLAVASWSAGDKVYLLGGFGDEQFLTRFL